MMKKTLLLLILPTFKILIILKIFIIYGLSNSNDFRGNFKIKREWTIIGRNIILVYYLQIFAFNKYLKILK